MILCDQKHYIVTHYTVLYLLFLVVTGNINVANNINVMNAAGRRKRSDGQNFTHVKLAESNNLNVTGMSWDDRKSAAGQVIFFFFFLNYNSF